MLLEQRYPKRDFISTRDVINNVNKDPLTPLYQLSAVGAWREKSHFLTMQAATDNWTHRDSFAF
jgi:hypothetical protein